MSAGLPIRRVEKPWGRDVLPAPFNSPAGQRIGEIWFEPPPELSELLVKYIFTSEALSVQVHPSDAETLAQGMGRQGKEECWLIVGAEPGAKLGIGFDRPLDSPQVRAAAMDGSIEHLMTWHSVRPGDFFYIPAGTVHAIGAGVSLIEVQQNSDITYRLYDYGRPRELHLDAGVAVAKAEPYPDTLRSHVGPREARVLVDGPLFRLEQIAGGASPETAARFPGPLLVIPREGPVAIGGESIAPGCCGLALSLDEVIFATSGVCLLAAACRA